MTDFLENKRKYYGKLKYKRMFFNLKTTIKFLILNEETFLNQGNIKNIEQVFKQNKWWKLVSVKEKGSDISSLILDPRRLGKHWRILKTSIILYPELMIYPKYQPFMRPKLYLYMEGLTKFICINMKNNALSGIYIINLFCNGIKTANQLNLK